MVRATHLGTESERYGFLRSDHCPSLLELAMVWREGEEGEGGEEKMVLGRDGKIGGGKDGDGGGGDDGGADVVVVWNKTKENIDSDRFTG